MRWPIVICAALALTACERELTPEEQAAENERIAERVREANSVEPPLVEVVPDAILYPDLEANDLFGLSCAYAPGTSMGARVIAREVDAYMKINGEMMRFAADPGARELPAKTWSLYNAREYSLRLNIEDKASGEQVGDGGAINYEGTIWLRDRWDRVVYQGSGTVNCGA
ncbi:hypothetical protein OZN62_01695 [Aurantiacibacter sp. MUD11]|uniref:hypothetical protein n=1 Tax=Aurantiacibacter sp. MUD11 TaxID=3003265 RepID=UPI0022AA8F91|nr:hypothetical protein [Aurantiacibacter sp. MUD11]WAT18316.1 hypothetical protein OZN62_01695 [Aurantiacibacter sp. MUD11]